MREDRERRKVCSFFPFFKKKERKRKKERRKGEKALTVTGEPRSFLP